MKCNFATFFVVNSNKCKLSNSLLILHSLYCIAPFNTWVFSIGITTRDARPNIKVVFRARCWAEWWIKQRDDISRERGWWAECLTYYLSSWRVGWSRKVISHCGRRQGGGGSGTRGACRVEKRSRWWWRVGVTGEIRGPDASFFNSGVQGWASYGDSCRCLLAVTWNENVRMFAVRGM